MHEPEGCRKLEIYKLGHSLGLRSHALTMTLPYFEHREEGSQLRRSSKSVTALIVEGYRQRKYRDDFLRYLHKAAGSADESREHLSYLRETGMLKDVEEGRKLEAEYDKLCGAIERFIAGVSRDHSKPFYLRAIDEPRHPPPKSPPPPQKSEISNPKSPGCHR